MFSSEKVISHRALAFVGKSRSLQGVPEGTVLHTLVAEQIPPERSHSLRILDRAGPLRLEHLLSEFQKMP